MSQFKSAEKVAWKVVADPSAPESAWLPACTVVGSKAVCKQNHRNAATGWFLLIASLLCALAASIGAQFAVDLGFDWGYYLTELLVKQPPSDQGFIAAIATAVLVPPMVFGAFAGQLSSIFSDRKWLRLLPFLGTLSFFAVMLLNSTRDSSVEFENLVEMGCLCAICLLLSQLAFSITRRLTCWLKKMSPGKAVFFAPMVMFSLLAPLADSTSVFSGHPLKTLAIYCAIIAAITFTGAFFSRARKAATSIGFAMGVSAPITIVMGLNVLCTVVSLFLDSVGAGAAIGWRACMSAVLILVATMLSTFTGGWIAAIVRRAGKSERRIAC